MPEAGILPINKPTGARSAACVGKIRSILGKKVKVGHGGTLDSTASGLLVILTGEATRLSNFITELPKRYEASVTFGVSTDTDDAEGKISEKAPYGHITDEAIDSAICGFLGWRMQAPPAVSAVHVDGKRAHALARSGEGVIPAPKPVCFIGVTRTSKIDERGVARFAIECRKGTYIRSFARDLGRRLGSCAHVSSLKRTSSGPFTADAAPCAETLFNMTKEELSKEIIPVPVLYKIFSSYEANDAAFEKLSRGQSVPLCALTRNKGGFETGRAIIAGEKIFSVCSLKKRGGTYEAAPETNILARGGNAS